MGQQLAEDPALAHAPRDELGVLPAVVEDDDLVDRAGDVDRRRLVGQLRGSVSLTRMIMYGVELYRRLKDETGVDPSWHEVGSLRIASTKERMEELTRQAAWAKTFGLPIELIGPKEAGERFDYRPGITETGDQTPPRVSG